MVRQYSSPDFAGVLDLWNTLGTAQGYGPADGPELEKLLTGHLLFDPRLAFLGPSGFVCGCMPDGETGYITCLLADREAAARQLLSALESAFHGLGAKRIAVNFRNPMALPWVIPHTPGHLHNNRPGVPTDRSVYRWLLNWGYIDDHREVGMYLDLAEFAIPQWVREKEETLRRAGYRVDWYRHGEHTGLEEMVYSLGSPVWNREIPAAARSVNMLVALSHSRVAGFAGPVYPEKSGRGYFAGIGVAPRYGGRGLGTLLFYRLCHAQKEAGSRYMSLFTGKDNPARRIYVGAGFRVCQEFACMEKEL